MSKTDRVFTVSTRSARTGPANEVFETFRCKPFRREASFAKRCCSQSRSAGFVERKGSLYPLSLSVRPGRRPEGESDNDPNCALCDRVGGVGPLRLYKPL